MPRGQMNKKKKSPSEHSLFDCHLSFMKWTKGKNARSAEFFLPRFFFVKHFFLKKPFFTKGYDDVSIGLYPPSPPHQQK